MYTRTRPTMFSQSTARLVTGKRFKVLSYVKGFCFCAKSLMFQPHATTRITDPLLSVTQDTRPFFQTPRACTLVPVLLMSGLDI